MTDSTETGITPRIIYFKYPKIKNTIKNITEEIDSRLNEIQKHRNVITNICPLPKRRKKIVEDNKIRNQLLNKTRRKNFLPTFTLSNNNSVSNYYHAETIQSYSNQKSVCHPPLNRNNSSLFKLQKNISFFNSKKVIPFTYAETNETSRQYNYNYCKDSINNDNSPIITNKPSVLSQVTPSNSSYVKRVRPFSCKAKIKIQKKIIKSCSQIYEDTKLLNQELIKEINSKENQSLYRASSQTNPNVLDLHKDLPFEKLHKSHHFYRLNHFMSCNKGYDLKDTFVKFKHIAKISPNESYKMRDMLGEEIGVSVKITEDGIKFIKKDSLREKYKKPEWVEITDKKGREQFNAILRQIETNKRKIAKVIEKYNLTD